jgi:hypothetical protein
MKFIIIPILILLTTHIMTREELLAEMQINIEALDGILAHHPDVLQDLDAGMTAELQEARTHLNKKDNKAKAEQGKRLKAAKKAAARAAKLAAKQKRIELKEQKRLEKQAAKEEGQEIRKHQFGRDMAGFVGELRTFFQNKISDEDKTPINVSKLKDKLETSFGTSLVGKYIHNQLCTKLNTYKNQPTRANLAEFFTNYLGENLNEYTYWADLLKKNKIWKKEYRKDKTMDDVLPSSEGVVNVLLSKDVEDGPTAEEIARKWLTAEYNNLKKMTFGEGINIYCDSFRLSLSSSLDQQIQSAICRNIGDKERRGAEVQAIILSNIQTFLSEKSLHEVFVDRAEIIKVYGGYDIILALDGNINAPDIKKAVTDSVAVFRKDLSLTDSSFTNSLVVTSRLGDELQKMVANQKQTTPYILQKLLTFDKSNPKPTIGDIITAIDLQAQSLVGDSKVFLACSNGACVFPLASRIVAAVESAKAKASPEMFVQAFDKWKAKIEGVFNGTKKNWRFDKDKLHTELKALFIEEATFLYEDFLKGMIDNSGMNVIPLTNKVLNEELPTDFAEIWKGVFSGCDSSYLTRENGVYNDLVQRAKSAQELEDFFSVLDSKLPNEDMLWTALGFSRHFDKKMKVPDVSEKFLTKVQLNPRDSSIKGHVGMTIHMPLAFKPFYIGEDNQPKFHPVVVQNQITIDKGNKGRYSFSEETAKVCQVSTEDSINGILYKVVISMLVKDDLQKSKGISDETTEGHYSVGGEMPIVGFESSYTEEHDTHGTSSGENYGAGGEFTVYLTMEMKSEQRKNNAETYCYAISFGDENGSGASDYGFSVSCDIINDSKVLKNK